MLLTFLRFYIMFAIFLKTMFFLFLVSNLGFLVYLISKLIIFNLLIRFYAFLKAVLYWGQKNVEILYNGIDFLTLFQLKRCKWWFICFLGIFAILLLFNLMEFCKKFGLIKFWGIIKFIKLREFSVLLSLFKESVELLQEGTPQ